MRRIALLLVLIPALAVPVMAPAAPSQQTQLQAERKLKKYGLETDTSLLTTSQIAGILLTTSDVEDRFFGSDFRTREQLKAILRKNPATNPDLQ